MPRYLIGYDLDKPDQDYAELIEALEGFDLCWHHLDSTWMIKTTMTTPEVRDYLWEHMGESDKLLVVELRGNLAWVGFEEDESDAIKKLMKRPPQIL